MALKPTAGAGSQRAGRRRLMILAVCDDANTSGDYRRGAVGRPPGVKASPSTPQPGRTLRVASLGARTAAVDAVVERYREDFLAWLERVPARTETSTGDRPSA
jgi:hypothetical protein